MKILRNKTYQGMVDKEVALTEERNLYYKKTCEYGEKIKELKNERETMLKDLCKYEDIIHKLKVNESVLEEEKHKLLGAKGGYTKEINKLKKQVEELTFKLKESMTDKYLVKRIPSGRRPKGPAMKLTSHAVVSSITRKMFNND